MQIYIASPFFTPQELQAVKIAETILRDKGYKVFSPREHENRSDEVGSRKWSENIFKLDKEAIDKSDVMVMLYHGGYSDSGTVWECGYAYAKNIPCIVVHLGKNSNLMVHEGSHSNLKSLEALKSYDFEQLLQYHYEGEMF